MKRCSLIQESQPMRATRSDADFPQGRIKLGAPQSSVFVLRRAAGSARILEGRRRAICHMNELNERPAMKLPAGADHFIVGVRHDHHDAPGATSQWVEQFLDHFDSRAGAGRGAYRSSIFMQNSEYSSNACGALV